MVRITELHKVQVGMPKFWEVFHREFDGKTTTEEFDEHNEALLYYELCKVTDKYMKDVNEVLTEDERECQKKGKLMHKLLLDLGEHDQEGETNA